MKGYSTLPRALLYANWSTETDAFCLRFIILTKRNYWRQNNFKKFRIQIASLLASCVCPTSLGGYLKECVYLNKLKTLLQLKNKYSCRDKRIDSRNLDQSHAKCWWVGGFLWHINHYGLFNAKSSSHLHFLFRLVGCLGFMAYQPLCVI